jgi:hypothetical protein
MIRKPFCTGSTTFRQIYFKKKESFDIEIDYKANNYNLEFSPNPPIHCNDYFKRRIVLFIYV